MNGLELFLLGRKLMKLGEDAIQRAGYSPLPTSVRSILADIFEHQNSSISEITARTGFPQSHVSAAVARLSAGGALVTFSDPNDRRRTLVGVSAELARRHTEQLPAPIDAALADALGSPDTRELAELIATLDTINRRLHTPRPAIGCACQ